MRPYDVIYKCLNGRVTGKHAESAHINLAYIISRLPDWAQQPLLREDVFFENKKASFYNPMKGLFSHNEGTYFLKVPVSGINNNLNLNRFKQTETVLHEFGHAVDFLNSYQTFGNKRAGTSVCNPHYRLYTRDFMWLRLEQKPSRQEMKIFRHSENPGYTGRNNRTYEIQAETANQYFAAYDALDGDAGKINTHMTQKLPNLWPPFRDHLIVDYKTNMKNTLPVLNERSESPTAVSEASGWVSREVMRTESPDNIRHR